MKKKLGIIHTTPVTIEPLKQLVAEIISNCDVINYLDDSILPELIDNGGKVETVEERWIQYAKFAEKAGANCVLSACSTVGGLVEQAQKVVNVPVLRIDEQMAEDAVAIGSKIGVAATLSTTLQPTIRLLERKATEGNKDVEIQPLLADTAYEKLINGDQQGHDKELVEKLEQLVKVVDVVVLAQASMARVLPKLPVELQSKFLTSPRVGIERVRKVMRGFE